MSDSRDDHKHKVLMLGWEFPPAMAGGLGTASAEIAKVISQKVDLQLFTPAWEGLPDLDYIHGVGEGYAQLYPEAYPYETDAEIFWPKENLKKHLVADPVEQTSEKTTEESPEPEAPAVSLPPLVFQQAASYAGAVIEEAADAAFDIIHVHDWLTALPGLALQKATGKPLILHVHALEYDRSGPEARGWVYTLEREALERADLVIPVSTYMATILVEHYGIDPQKIQAVPHGGPAIEPYRKESRFGGKVISFVGRLSPQKNPYQVLNLAEVLLAEFPELTFVLAGDGREAEALLEETVRRGLEMQVLFTGFLAKEALYDLLAMSDVFVMPSWSEPFGLAAVEAAAFGVPCLLSERCGAVEILRSALIARPDDTTRQAELVGDLLANPDKQAWLGKLMQEEAASFSWEDAGEAILALYDRMH
ncbi:MAG: glycosyltransferase family 4 protein [Bacteroidia bacterium]